MRCTRAAVGSAALVLAVALTAAALAGEAGEGQGDPHALDIRPAQNADWGANLRDVKKVLCSAANELWVYFPERRLEPILVEPKGGPIILFRRGPKGAYRVRLDTGKTYWSQYAFQFAHEFCHILCNYTEDESSNKWFEESICEMASLFALRAMAETWKTAPPYPNWKSYASALRKYADTRIEQRRLPADTTLAEWYKQNEAELRKNPTLRDKNRVVAGALLPLFEKEPVHWEAVTYLNAGSSQRVRTFKEYLADWHRHSPAKHKGFVRRIAQRFGIRLPAP